MKRIFRARDFRPDAQRDVNEELQTHLDLKMDDLMAQGMSEEEARVEAERALGNPDRDGARAARHTRARLRRRSVADRLETLLRDGRYALRRMARSPGFTLVAVLSLGIGIGANTAVFSAVNAFLIRRAPFRDSQELVRVYTSHPQLSPYSNMSYPDFLDLRGLEDVFSGAGATRSLSARALLGDGSSIVTVEALSAGLMPMLGVEPVLGRGFLPDEDSESGAHPVAILGNGFWRRAFGADPGVLGRTITVAGRPLTIVGVAPDWFTSPTLSALRMDLFVPMSMYKVLKGGPANDQERRDLNAYGVVARLAPGRSAEGARAILAVLAGRLQAAFPETNADRSFTIVPADGIAIHPQLDQNLRLTAAFLLVVVGLVLLLACTNLASFLLARGAERQKEVALRLALGASRGRLIHQLFAETLLLGLMGGAVGLILARATLSLVLTFQPSIPIPLSLEMSLDHRVLLFTLGISVLAGILFGLAPALQSSKGEVVPTLKECVGAGSRRRVNLQSGLVTLQMTVSMILMVGAGLFLRSLITAQSIDPGFSTEKAGIAWVSLQGSGIPEEEWDMTRVALEERFRAQRGVKTVASASRLPLALAGGTLTFRIPGADSQVGEGEHLLDVARVSPGYFDAMEIPIVQGRALTDEDRAGAPEVIVVSREMARRFWPGEDPLGKQVLPVSGQGPLTVVGVAQDVMLRRLSEVPTPLVYLASAQNPVSSLQILVRGQIPDEEMVPMLRRVVQEARPSLMIVELKTMDDVLSVHFFGARIAATLLSAFGILALFLSSIGLYGVVSFSVSRRMREVGIRMSLGAGTGQVVRMVVGHALGTVLIGSVVGLGLALFLARLARVFLTGVSPSDPVTMAGVTLLLVVVAVVAALIPAMRAGRANPVEALRSE